MRYQLSIDDTTIDLNHDCMLETLGDLLRLPLATPHPDQLYYQIFQGRWNSGISVIFPCNFYGQLKLSITELEVTIIKYAKSNFFLKYYIVKLTLRFCWKGSWNRIFRIYHISSLIYSFMHSIIQQALIEFQYVPNWAEFIILN